MRLLPTLLSIVALTMPAISPAKGEASYSDPEKPPGIVISETLDLLTLNVAHARGTALNQLLVSTNGHRENLDDIASMILGSGVHVAALQEADAPSLWSGRFDHVAYLAEATNFHSSVHGHHADSWLFTYGAVLVSSVSLEETWSHRFSPSWPTAGKGFVAGSVQWQEPGDDAVTRRVSLASVHLDFSRKSVRRGQIAEVISELKDSPRPLIVMGDFNADWSDPESPVRQLASALDLRAYRPGDTGLATYKDRDRLDWILISPELEFADYTVLKDVVSDHLAVVARIAWIDHESHDE